MAYFVQIADEVEAYVHGVVALPLERRRQVLDGRARDLADRADHFLQGYPLGHESYTFSYEYVLADGGVIYSFRFVVDGASMATGVVQVVYADFETMPIPS